jgi:hypothetical protein
MPEPPLCCLCGQPCEPWVLGESGWGHNPEPLAGSPNRCCNTCNDTKVIPARIQIMTNYPIPNSKKDN